VEVRGAFVADGVGTAYSDVRCAVPQPFQAAGKAGSDRAPLPGPRRPKPDPAGGRRGQVDGRLRAGPAVAAGEHLNLPPSKCRADQRISPLPSQNSIRSVFIVGAAQPEVAFGLLLEPS